MTKSSRKTVPEVGIELGAACMPSRHASDQAVHWVIQTRHKTFISNIAVFSEKTDVPHLPNQSMVAISVMIWFDFCFTALQHILGHFERGQLP